jgi:23S rRNA (guanosine2251-2'-O)-methyltransferase
VELLYGRNSVGEALRARRGVHRVLVARGAHGLEPLMAEANRRHVAVELVDRERLDRLLGDAHHQGVAAEADAFAYAHLDDLVPTDHPALLLALDSLQDPQNFGTLLRTAQAVGVDGVIVPEHRAVGVTPAVSNASAGAVEHLKVARVTNLVRVLKDLKQRGVWVYGLDIGNTADQAFWDVDLAGPVAVVVGSEGPGLGRLVRETCDGLMTIPMAAGAIQSLNASVAGSIVLYTAYRQRRLG